MRRIDITPGDRYGHLVVIEEVGSTHPRRLLVRCDCGTEKVVYLRGLRGTGRTTMSCGCIRGEPLDVHPGDRYGRLEVVREVERRQQRRTFQLRCDCGEMTVATLHALRSGNTKSCGCLRGTTSVTPVWFITHGLSDHPHYHRWWGMMARCYKPDATGFDNYGGRGIAVCAAWHDVRVYVEYLDNVLGPPPEGHTLDRIDNDGDYEPGNVRWADRLTQTNNRRAPAA